MCGIVGFWNRDGEAANQKLLKPMMERIRHRGPDDAGTWAGGPIALGHLRLSILDLSPRGHQPFITADGKGVLTYNGEIYNYPQLRKELENEGVEFKSNTDSEVVLYALHQWGPEKAVPRFNGMFGLAYLDLREKTLWLTRDRLGIKPLYVACPGEKVIFASEPKALLTHPSVPCRPNMRVLAEDLIGSRIDGHWTPFEGIRSLSPGSLWKVTQNTVEKITYFDVIDSLNVDRIIDAIQHPQNQFVTQFDSAFCESVQIHLASDAPLATMCSGGLDSSLVTAVAAKYKPNLVAYVADVKGVVSEGEKADVVGRHVGVEIRQIDFGLEDNMRLWPLAVWLGDQSNCHPHDMAFYAVVQACREDGIKVLLTGEGADELFGGYTQQRDAYRYWRSKRIRHRLTPNFKPFRMLARRFPNLFPLNLESLKRYPFDFTPEAPDRLLRQSCILDSDRETRTGMLFDKLAPIEPLEDRAFLARCMDHLYGHLQSLLHRNDRMGMGASIESRVPFLENQLIDLGMHMPLKAKYFKKTEKWVVKEAGKPWLPRETVAARKMGFQFNPHFFAPATPLLKDGALAELFGWSSMAQPILLNQIRSSNAIAFKLVGMELWARIFLRGESPQELGEELVRLTRASAV